MCSTIGPTVAICAAVANSSADGPGRALLAMAALRDDGQFGVALAKIFLCHSWVFNRKNFLYCSFLWFVYLGINQEDHSFSTFHFSWWHPFEQKEGCV